MTLRNDRETKDVNDKCLFQSGILSAYMPDQSDMTGHQIKPENPEVPEGSNNDE